MQLFIPVGHVVPVEGRGQGGNNNKGCKYGRISPNRGDQAGPPGFSANKLSCVHWINKKFNEVINEYCFQLFLHQNEAGTRKDFPQLAHIHPMGRMSRNARAT